LSTLGNRRVAVISVSQLVFYKGYKKKNLTSVQQAMVIQFDVKPDVVLLFVVHEQHFQFGLTKLCLPLRMKWTWPKFSSPTTRLLPSTTAPGYCKYQVELSNQTCSKHHWIEWLDLEQVNEPCLFPNSLDRSSSPAVPRTRLHYPQKRSASRLCQAHFDCNNGRTIRTFSL
jgi:hypothetical protein